MGTPCQQTLARTVRCDYSNAPRILHMEKINTEAKAYNPKPQPRIQAG